MNKLRPSSEHEKTIPRAESHSIASERHPWLNMDATFTVDAPGCALAGGVCDGVGGDPGSERAAQVTAEIAHQVYSQPGTEYLGRAEAALLTRQTLIAAQEAIRDDYAEVATTAAMTTIHTDPETGQRFANIAWLGDSRVYVIRDGEILYRTLDDGMVHNSPILDEMYSDEAPEYRVQAFLESVTEVDTTTPAGCELAGVLGLRNMIDNCLDGWGEPNIHPHQVDVLPGDIILVTSDGVHDNLTNQEILAGIRDGATAEQQVGAALTRSRSKQHRRAKSDDITAVILRVPPRTTTELLCKEAGIPYTKELQDLDAASVRIAEIARLVDLLHYLNSLRPPQPAINVRFGNNSKPFETF